MVIRFERGIWGIPSKPPPPDKIKPLPLLHDQIKEMLYEIGQIKGWVSVKEYPIDSERIDVAWKRIEGKYPFAVFEVQISGNFYEALVKLKRAWNIWNSHLLFLVTTEQYRVKALEWIGGSFHEIEGVIRVIDCEKVKELCEAVKKAKSIKEELGIP